MGVKLEVTPIIHPNDFIEMSVKPEVKLGEPVRDDQHGEPDSGGGAVDDGETKVRVKSGVYIVLGGLMKKEARKTSSGVPVVAEFADSGAVVQQ